MGHSVLGGMQRLNIEAARRQAGQELLQTPNPSGFPPPASAGGSGTPISLSTPDILNSLIAITNPFFESTSSENATQGCGPQDADEPQEKKVFANLETPSSQNGMNKSATATSIMNNSTSTSSSINNNNRSSISTISSGSSQPLPSLSSVMGLSSMTSHTGGSSNSGNNNVISNNNPPPPQLLQLQPQPLSSVKSMRSQLIKEGLKLTIQSKRKISGKGELDVKSEMVAKRPKREEVELTYDFNSISNDSHAESLSPTKLTPEDEERRRRRRERNKVAATKCRNKKKEKTFLLVKEAEVLEDDNISLKSEIAQLDAEHKRLQALLSSHAPTCLMNPQVKHSAIAASSSHVNHTSVQQNAMGSSFYAPSTTNNSSGGMVNGGGGNDQYNNLNQQQQQQQMNPHLTINGHHLNNNNHNNNHSNNHFVPSNLNSMGYFNQIHHHQPIQLS